MGKLGPVDHIARPALPWRDADLTECGMDLTDLNPARVLTRPELHQRIKDYGRQRAAFSTCITCCDTARRWDNADPVTVLHREANDVHHAYGRDDRRQHRRTQLLAELEAITALITAHRGEFDGYLTGLGETVSLADRRRRRSRP